MGNVMKNNKD